MNTDSWTERWPEHPAIRTLPPRSGQVDIGKALPLGRGEAARADYVGMRVNVYLSGLRPAPQTHWFQIHSLHFASVRAEWYPDWAAFQRSKIS